MSNTTTGKDTLYLQVADKLMPEKEGYSPSEVVDEILVRGDFSIRDVVDATLLSLTQHLDNHLKSTKKESVGFPMVYKAKVERENGRKRLVLFSSDNQRLLTTQFYDRHEQILCTYNGIEYKQHGDGNKVYLRIL